MTYTMALATSDAIELWESQRFFNPGPPVRVIVVGRRRWRLGDESPVTVRELIDSGYKRVHRLDHSFGK